MEIRSYTAEASPKIDGRTIQGYGSVFGRQSRILYDVDKKHFFIEVIERGAITDELIRSCDIKALMEHNKQRLLARSNMGTGSLLLSVDDYGLAYKFDAPNTQCGNDAIEMIITYSVLHLPFGRTKKGMLPTSERMASFSVLFTR